MSTASSVKPGRETPTRDSIAPAARPAATAWIAEHQRWLRLVIWSRVPDHAAVDEVWQEVALAVARCARQGQCVDNPAAWLYRVAVRQCLLFRRARGRARKLLNGYARFGFAPALEPDPLSWIIERERNALVRAAIRRLPPADAELLLLKYTENWSAPALAQRLGLSLACVEARLHRARRRLRETLAHVEVLESTTH
jgi:RNA polymerase sigma-70 factor (ECF subfamily)